MKPRNVVQSFVALLVLPVLLIVFSAPLAATGSAQTGETVTPMPTPIVLPWDVTPTPPSVVAVAVVKPPATNPDTAQEPSGTWVYIAPSTSHWYKMNDAGLQLDVWIDANGQSGLSLAIFAPEQTDLYGKPIGRGSFNKFEPAHDLSWTGYTRARGMWYAQVTNAAQLPISYQLSYKRTINSVAGRCSACHGQDIEWDRCVSHGSNWCEELKNEYNGN